MKFNWGYAIAFVYLAFVIAMIGVVIKSRTVDPNLVSDDYYNKNLVFQDQIDRKQNALSLKENVRVKVLSQAGIVQIAFPNLDEVVTGDITFFRPSNNRLDQNYAIALDSNNHMRIPVQDLAKGLWKVKINWSAGEEEFFFDDSITL